MPFKIAFIGAGSIGFTRGLLRDVLAVDEFHDINVAFTDISERNLDMVTQLCQRDIECNGLKIKIQATLDRREALKDARYVFNVVRIGGLEAFQTDIDIPLKYGIDQCVGDTLCAGGIMYGQRGIAAVLEFCNVEHRLIVEKDKPCRMLNVEFGFGEKAACMPPFGVIAQTDEAVKKLLCSGLSCIVLKDNEEVYVALKSLIAELDRNSGKGSLLEHMLFAQLLIKISRLYCETLGKSTGPGAVHIKKAVQYMRQHYDRDIQVCDIAEAANVHPGYLHRIFKKYTGSTINDYLINIRMDKAKALLANTDIQVTDISSYVGINSRQYFAFLFKKHTGVSPSLYRKTSSKHASKYAEKRHEP